MTKDLVNTTRDLLIVTFAKCNGITQKSLSDALCYMYTIIIDKTTHKARPNYPDTEEYGWAIKDGVLQQVPANGPLWPQDLFETVSCGSKKGCSRNCSYAKGSAKFKRQTFKATLF